MSIEIQNLSFSYSLREVLREVSLVVEQGQLLAVLGPNGVGKTTLAFTADKPLETDKVKAAIAEAQAALNGQGRLLVRPSGTEKLIRVMAEGDDEALVKQAVSSVSAAVRAAG